MSETRELQRAVNACRDDLLNCMMQAKERAEIGKQNKEKAKRVEAELKVTIEAREKFRECINHMVTIYKNIEQYASDRKELSLEMLKAAISKAGYIVPDADTRGISLKVTDRRAKVVNSDGQDINMREGSAFRTVMGANMRYTLLKAQPNAIQALFFDEGFNTLSDATINAMREYFDVFKEDTLIVGIEQHDTMFQGFDKTVYRAVKGDDKVTIIRKE
jgi:hypothetical protein